MSDPLFSWYFKPPQGVQKQHKAVQTQRDSSDSDGRMDARTVEYDTVFTSVQFSMTARAISES